MEKSISDCCSKLISERQSDRKTAADKLGQLLKRQNIVQLIDERTSNPAWNPNAITWNEIYESVCTFVKLEGEFLSKMSNKASSASSVSAFQKRRITVCTLYKSTIHAINKRGLHLSAQRIISHILMVMKTVTMRELFGADYSNILLKEFLCIWKYLCDMQDEHWQDLISIYCKLTLVICQADRASVPYDRQTLVEVLIRLLAGVGKHCQAIYSPTLFTFFKEIFDQKVDVHIFKGILSAWNHFQMAIAINCRNYVCNLGEHILSRALSLWNKSRMDCKDEIIAFVKTQLAIHYPRGTHEVANGVFIQSKETWEKNLCDFLELLESELHSRTRITNTMFPDSFLDVMADVLHQVLRIQKNVKAEQMEPSPRKKAKVRTKWMEILSKLNSSHENDVSAWLSLLIRLFDKYPKDILLYDCQRFLRTLLSLRSKSKGRELINLIFRTELSLFIAYGSRGKEQNNNYYLEELSLQNYWKETWGYVNARKNDDPPLNVLASLLCYNLVDSVALPWEVVFNSTNGPTRSGLNFLITYLQRHDLPESASVSTSKKNVSALYPLRCQLMRWILPLIDNEDFCDNGSTELNPQFGNTLQRLNPDVISNFLIALTNRRISDSSVLYDINFDDDVSTSDVGRRLAEIQKAYLCFETTREKEMKKPVKHRQFRNNAYIDGLIQYLLELLNESTNKIIKLAHCIEVEKSANRRRIIEILLTLITWHSGVVAKTCYSLLQMNFFGQDGLRACDAFQNINTMLQLSFSFINQNLQARTTGISHKEDDSMLARSLRVLIKMLPYEDKILRFMSQKEVKRCLSFNRLLLNEVFPKSLINLLYQILEGKHNEVTKRISVSASNDEFYIEEHAPDRSKINTNSANNGHDSLSRESINRLEAERICCATFLLKIYSCELNVKSDISSTSIDAKINSKVLRTLYSTKIRTILSRQLPAEDIQKPIDLQLFFTCAKVLARSCCYLPGEDLQLLLELLLAITRENKWDNVIRVEGLYILHLLSFHFVPLKYHCDKRVIDSCRDICCIIFTAFWMLLSKQKYRRRHGCHVKVQFAKCLLQYCKIDSDDHWCGEITDDEESGNNCKSVKKMFLDLLCDDDHEVRMFVSTNLSSVFFTSIWERDSVVKNDPTVVVPLSKIEQRQIYEEIESKLTGLLNFKESNPSDTDKCFRDNNRNKTVSALQAVSSVVVSVAVCEKRGLYFIFKIAKKNGEWLDLISKVLLEIARLLNYDRVDTYLQAHLAYLIDRWLSQHSSLLDFPYLLLQPPPNTSVKEYDMLAFVKDYYLDIIPCIIAHRDVAMLQTIIEVVSADVAEILNNCFSRCMIHILPGFALAEWEGSRTEKENSLVSNSVASYEIMENQLSRDLINKLAREQFDQIIVDLLSCLYETSSEPSDMAKFVKDNDPEPNPPFYTTHIIKCTLNYLCRSWFEKNNEQKTVVSMLNKAKNGIQSILLALSIRLDQAHFTYERRREICIYRLFVQLIVNEFPNGLKDTAAYCLRDIIYTLVRTINKPSKKRSISSHCVIDSYEDDMLLPCLDLVKLVSKAGLTGAPKEFSKHVHIVTATLVPLAERNDRVGQAAIEIINYLISDAEWSHEYIDALLSIDPFPKLPQFKTVNKVRKNRRASTTSLQDIEQFTSNSSRCNTPMYRLDGIKYLKELLLKSRDELFKADGSNNDGLRVKLILELLHLNRSTMKAGQTSNFTNDISYHTREEIGRCLGELGAANLDTVTLCTYKRYRRSVIDGTCDEKMNLTSITLRHLANLLTHHEVKIVQAASQCLKNILPLPECQDFLSSDESNRNAVNLYLIPFACMSEPSAIRNLCDRDRLTLLERITHNYFKSQHDSHGSWITQLTTELAKCAKDAILQRLAALYVLEAEFAELSFPYLIKDILVSFGTDSRVILSKSIKVFFSKPLESQATFDNCKAIGQSKMSRTKLPYSFRTESYRTVLETINFLRTQERTSAGTVWENNFWLDLNFLDIAKAAQHCSAYYTSLLYVEIWYYHMQDSNRDKELSKTDYRSVLLDAYSNIGEPDYLYGVESQQLASFSSRIRMYRHEDKWSDALIAYDIQNQLQFGYQSYDSDENDVNYVAMIEGMRNSGLYHTMEMYITALLAKYPEKSHQVSEFQFESTWRCACWNESPFDSQKLIPTDRFHSDLYLSIRAIHDREESNLVNLIRKCRLRIMNEMSEKSLESVMNFYDPMMRFQQLLELEEFGDCILNRYDITDLLENWDNRLQTCNSRSEFCFVEPIIALRCSLLSLLTFSKSSQGDIRNSVSVNLELAFASLRKHLHTYTTLARQTGRYQMAENALFRLKQLLNRNDYTKFDISDNWQYQLEESQWAWAKGESEVSKCIMQNLIMSIERHLQSKKNNSNIAKALYCRALCLYGKWLGDTYSENPNNVIECYLQKSVQLLQDSPKEMPSVAIDAFVSLALYADTQYQKIATYLKSSEFEEKKELIRHSKSDLKLLKNAKSAGVQGNTKRYKKTLELQSRIDESEENQLLRDKLKFLDLALNNYIRCLQVGDHHDVRVFRLCSLWFENYQHSTINEIIEKEQQKIHSRKFLPLMYQLAARMGSSVIDEKFHDSLNQIIFRAGREHPYHTLPIILALSNAGKDDKIINELAKNTGTKLHHKRSDTLYDQKLTDNAKQMIARLSFTDIGGIIEKMEYVCNAYIELAYLEVPQSCKRSRTHVTIPTSTLLSKISQSKQLPILTCDIKIDPTCLYENMINIEKIEPTYRLVGGINLPKIIRCIGTDGIARQQLVKGKDDLRQDAVMQQIFNLVNVLLANNVEASKRKLQIRTYKVVPLSQRSGIVEWCENTQPIGQYLVGDSGSKPGAHSRYYPDDWNPIECKRKIASSSNKLHTYQDITNNFHPVFRHFFFENFLDPAAWFERRLAYTRSVASTSIVGYMVGLGDRHVQNILIDRTTAELIHIDFGVAFEQGHILPTPETVPFRLTRDLVDGMGITGIEGVFRRCCEKTMEVMRNSQDSLLTILEVLLYDPLYAWNISPLKAMTLQRKHSKDQISTESEEDDELSGSVTGDADLMGNCKRGDKSNQDKSSGNKMAERALWRVRQKLSGTENGIVLSVDGQVNRLIHEARDAKNLCKLFYGWQAWV